MSLFKSVAAFGGITLISRLTGFVRDMFLANFLGAGAVSDAFFVAFKLPNLFRNLFAEGAFTSAFVPMLSHKLVSENKEKALHFASQAISILAFVLFLLVLFMEIIMPMVVPLLAPGFITKGGDITLATQLSRITFPFLFFVSVVSFQSGVLNSFGRFAAPAAASIILNLTMIASVFMFIPFSITPAHGMAWGVFIAGILEVIWLSFFLRRENISLRPDYHFLNIFRNPDIRTLFRRIAPGILGAGVYQINMVVDTILVSLVGAGAISWLYYANRLQQLPLGVVGASISVALLPILSRHIKAGEKTQAENTQNKAVEYGALLSIPAAVALIVLADPIINLLFQHGRFGAFETLMTAQAVIAYSVGLPFYVIVKALTPNFFARGDTRTPVKYSIVVLITNLTFSLLLIKPFGHVGIASATTIAAVVSLYQYCHGLKKRGYWNFSRQLSIKILKITISSLVMGALLVLSQYAANACFGNWLETPYLIKIPVFATLCFISLISFAIMARLTGVLDIMEIAAIILKKGKK